MNAVIKALEEENGGFRKESEFLIYGNPVNPKIVVLFEKQAIFEKAIESVEYITKRNSLFICGYGIPSESCIKYVGSLKFKKILYFGDLDAASFYIYLVFKYCKQMPTQKDKIKLSVRYAGVTVDDYNKYLFDKLTDVYHSGTKHEEEQPPHLVIADYDICNNKCTEEYGNPCQHFCPAQVYEMVEDPERLGKKKLKLTPSNCVHCKTCDIADPYQIIKWVVPEGGGGPNYTNM